MRYSVQIPVSGFVSFEVEAATVQRAVAAALAEFKANRLKNAQRVRVRQAPGAVVADEG